ncbi:hypothetical protein [Mesobacterium pallidum]|uniref:dioxygenase family protein n=1 Tax=Mesobacterium pallidum TaxID=2872037 RepID=UPI001EE3751A|nr:hypothetical protein [Mesobacterium pallidum]
MTDHTDDHDLGFAHDLPRLLGRRRLLALGGAALVMTPGMASAACVATPRETAGPFPADGTNRLRGASDVVNVLTQEGVIRRDLRPSFNGLAPVAAGTRLDLRMTLVSVGDVCTPLAGRAVYAWHCDGVGRYSLYDDPDRNYLRGVGISDAEGNVDFTTIFPGCYPSRWPHIHFEVWDSAEEAVSGRAARLTSQLALPEAQSAAVYAADTDAYAGATRNLARNDFDRDGIFRDNSAAEKAQQMVALTGDPAAGYSGTVTVGLA